MNESTLNALINLFAVFSIKGKTDYQTAEKNLEEYLSNHLGIRNTAEYIALFFEIYDLYNSGVLVLTDENTRDITGKICNQIKSRIHHADQLMIFLHFLELARRDFNSIEHEIYDYVADIFEITPEDYKAFKQFIFCEKPSDIDSGGFLVINQEEESHSENLLHLCKPSPHGDLLFLYVSETGQFIFKYFGHDALTVEGGSIRRLQFYVLNQGKERGFRQAQLSIYMGNTPAQRAYEKLGFKIIDEWRDPYFEKQIGSPGMARMVCPL